MFWASPVHAVLGVVLHDPILKSTVDLSKANKRVSVAVPMLRQYPIPGPRTEWGRVELVPDDAAPLLDWRKFFSLPNHGSGIVMQTVTLCDQVSKYVPCAGENTSALLRASPPLDQGK